MTPSRFKHIARFVFGARWKGRMAAALGVDKRVVQRWAAGKRAIPAETVPAIEALVRAVQPA